MNAKGVAVLETKSIVPRSKRLGRKAKRAAVKEAREAKRMVSETEREAHKKLVEEDVSFHFWELPRGKVMQIRYAERH